MPWSWIRVSRGTSDKVRKLTAGDSSAAHFESSVKRLAEGAGAQDVDVKFEPDGLASRVLFRWDDAQVKYAVVFDLHGEEVVDLLSAEEMESVAAGRGG